MKDRIYSDTNFRLKVAETSPSDLFWSFSFWTSQIPFLILLILYAATSFILFDVVYPKSTEPISYLSIFIQLFSILGLIVGAKSLAEIYIEQAISLEVEELGGKHLGAIKGKSETRLELSKLEEEFLPNNQNSPPPAMIRLFQHIIREAADRKFESSVNIVEPYKEESIKSIFTIQSFQRIALRLGILGTFIGLIYAMGDAQQFGNETDFRVLISDVFGSLHISFSTSIAGLQVAIILGFLLLIIRGKQDLYFREMETAVITMNSLAYNAINKDDFLGEFGRINSSIEQLNERIFQQTTSIEKIKGAVKLQTSEIENGIKKLVEAKSNFNSFIKTMEKEQITFIEDVNSVHQKFIDDVKSVYEIVSLKNLSMEIKNGIVQAGKNISNSIKPNINLISNKLEEFSLATDSVKKIVDEQNKFLSENLNKIAENNKKQSDTIKDGIQRITFEKSQHDLASKNLSKKHSEFLSEISEVKVVPIKEMSNGVEEVLVMGKGKVEQLNSGLEKSLKYIKRIDRLIDKRSDSDNGYPPKKRMKILEFFRSIKPFSAKKEKSSK